MSKISQISESERYYCLNDRSKNIPRTKQLKILLLDDALPFNMLFKFGEKPFTNNKDLVYLELSHIGIDSQHVDIFKHLNQLKFLNFSHNQIQHVDDHLRI